MSGSQFFFKVSGKKVALESHSSAEWCVTERPGGWVLAERKREDGSIERRRFALHEAQGKLSAAIGSGLWHGELQQPARGGTAAVGGGDSDLTAQFPGKVRKILVTAGDVVAEGAPLLLVEAMKMEFAIKAPARAKVIKLLVTEGQQLTPGDRFLEIEPVV